MNTQPPAFGSEQRHWRRPANSRRDEFHPTVEALEERWAPAVIGPMLPATQGEVPAIVGNPLGSNSSNSAAVNNNATGGRGQTTLLTPPFPGITNNQGTATPPSSTTTPAAVIPTSPFNVNPAVYASSAPFAIWGSPQPAQTFYPFDFFNPGSPSPSDALSAQIAALAAAGASVPARPQVRTSYYPPETAMAADDLRDIVASGVTVIAGFGIHDTTVPAVAIISLADATQQAPVESPVSTEVDRGQP